MKSKLLLSASIVSLAIGLSGGAHASPPNAAYVIDTNISGDFNVPHAIGTGASSTEVGLLISDSAVVTGDIINDTTIQGSHVGVDVNDFGTLEGAFINKAGGNVTARDINGGSAIGVYEGGNVSAQDVENSGHILASALLVANQDGTVADLYDNGANALGILQINGEAPAPTNRVSNDGHIVANANAEVNGSYIASHAGAIGVAQFNIYGSTVLNTLSNKGHGHITASAVAHATGYGGEADASAYASGVAQAAGQALGTASNVLSNDGVINATAQAFVAEHTGAAIDAFGEAVAIGVHQYGYATGGTSYSERDKLTNHGTIHASAFVSATGDSVKIGTDTIAGTTVDYGNAQSKFYGVPSDAAIGVFQVATDAYIANESVDNLGVIEAYGAAIGTGDTVDLNVAAAGVLQMATDIGGTGLGGTATALVHNESGAAISAYASAGASRTQNGGWTHNGSAAFDGHAQASAAGVFQFVMARSEANVTVVNDGFIGAYARAEMSVTENGSSLSHDVAFAGARATGIAQVAVATENPLSAHANVTNNGSVYAEATAGAFGNGGSYVDVTALAEARGVSQFVVSQGDAMASVINNSSIEAFAFANAGFTDTYGYGHDKATATAIGVDQMVAINSNSIDDSWDASLSVNNGTAGRIEAYASAHAAYAYTADSGSAQAHALAIGVNQQFAVNTAISDSSYNHATVVNEGFIGAYATANIDTNYYGGTTGVASAFAFGVRQDRTANATGDYFNFSLDNSGTIYAAAEAYASEADAAAVGVLAGDANYFGVPPSEDDVTLNLKQTNEASGIIGAQAVAGGTDANTAYALAVGIADRAGELEGTVQNLGHIYASAYVSATTGIGTARAVGIDAEANYFDDLTVTNKGTIVAYANADGGNAAFATGILLEPYTSGDGGDATIVNDGGTIFAGVGFHDGAPVGVYSVNSNESGFQSYFDRNDVTRGNAINVASLTADQSIEIDLKGTDQTGNIYGNILLGDGDNNPLIVVSNGLTRFNGVIEPDTNFDPGVYNGTGTLDIKDGGTFKLVLNQDPETPYEYRFTGLTNADQPQVYVDNLNVEAGGVLSIGLSPETTVGHYGQVFAANLENEDGPIAGDLKAHFIPGKYGNPGATWVYNSVVNSPDVNGGAQFNDVYSNTPLIDVSATYTGDHVNLKATRVSFEDAADNTNRKSVGAAIDSFYGGLGDPTFEQSSGGNNYLVGPDLTSFDDLIASIFALDGTQAYEDMMDKLSAEPYAQQLNQALTSFDGLQNLLLDRVTNGGGGGSGGALGYGEEKTAANSPASNALVTASLPPQPKADLWVRGFGDWQSQSDPSSALGYSGSQAGGYIGGDMYAAPNLIIGAAGGLTSSSMRFDNGDHISNSGFQIAGYGRWDSNAWYVRGFGGYGQYSNDSTRIVPILMTPTEMKGAYDTKVAGGYAEVGFKGFAGPSGGIIPFAGLSAAWASNGAFTESGGSASLDVAGANATRLASSFGGEVVWNTVLGTMPFEALVRAAWQHVWTGGASSVDASFINAPDPSNGFTSTSTLAGDLAAVSASGTWKVAPMTSLTAQYDGKFGSGFVDTTISGVFKQQF